MKKVGIISLIIIVGGFITIFVLGNMKLNSSKVTYDGTVIKWANLPLVDYYEISVDGSSPIIVDTQEYAFASTGDFTVTINAYRYFDFVFKPHKVEKTFKVLGKTSNLKYSEGSLSWDQVENATQYIVEMNGKVVKSDVKVTEYLYNTPGKVSIRVKAAGPTNEYYSYWSDVYEITILETPKNISYDGKTGLITWEKVNNSTGYTIKINNDEFSTDINSFTYAALDEDFEVSVKARGNNISNYFDSVYSEKVKYLFLDSVVGYQVKDGILTWDSVKNADGYYLKDGNTVHTLTKNEYTNLIAGTSYALKIMPFSNNANYFANWNDAPVFTILNAPSIRYENGVIIWESISNATGYTIEIDKDGTITNKTISGSMSSGLEYRDDYMNVGVYKIKVKSNSTTDGSYYDSKYSSAITITRLDAPSGHSLYDNPLEDELVKVTVTSVPNASGYIVIADGVEVKNIDTNNFSLGVTNDNYASINGTIVNVKIKSKGAGVVNANTVILDSLTSHDFSLTKLAVPTLTISENYANWTAVSNATGYVIEIDGKLQFVEANKTNAYLNIEKDGQHTIKIKAKGNGTNVISSDFDNGINLTKLAAPTNVKINATTLSWDKVAQAQGYYIKFGNGNITYTGTETSYSGLANIATTTAQSVVVYAIGNKKEILDSNSSINTTFQKLPAPTNVTINNDNIVWNPVANSVGYKISINNEIAATINATSRSHEDIIVSAGSYNVKIYAMGNGSQYFDSDYSGLVTVNKLPAPTIRINTTNYKSIVWDQNNETSQVKVYFDKKEMDYSKTTTSFIPTVAAVGTYTISVRNVGSGDATTTKNGTISSKLSNVIEFKTEKLVAPTITHTVNINPNKVTITVTNPSSIDGVTYKYNNGSDVFTAETTQAYNISTNGKFTYYAVAVGGMFNMDDPSKIVYYLDSVSSNPINVTFLPEVYSIEFSTVSEAKKKVTFKIDSNDVVKYRVEVNYVKMDSSTESVTNYTTTKECVIDYSTSTYSSMTVTIIAEGNGTTIINSLGVSQQYYSN